MSLYRFAVVLAMAVPLACSAQRMPSWSKGANAPAQEKGQRLKAEDVDNVPDLHGNPELARLVLFVGGNQFFVMPKLIDGFERLHPEVRGHIFYETLPPGFLRKQMEAGGVLTLGNLTLRVLPDVYEAGAKVLDAMQKSGQVDHVNRYATNTLEIMVARGNPKRIKGLTDLGDRTLRLSMPNAETEGVARQIAESLRKAGGEPLAEMVYTTKVADGSSYLTQIHHRQTPMRIMAGKSDAGVVWASELRFQEQIGNPLEGVRIPDQQNVTAVYAAGVVKDAPHRNAAEAWVRYLTSPEAQSAYQAFGFKAAPTGEK
jgi:molybdate transport system substrate-binding protein